MQLWTFYSNILETSRTVWQYSYNSIILKIIVLSIIKFDPATVHIIQSVYHTVYAPFLQNSSSEKTVKWFFRPQSNLWSQRFVLEGCSKPQSKGYNFSTSEKVKGCNFAKFCTFHIHEIHDRRPISWFGPWFEFEQDDFSTCNREKRRVLWYSFISYPISTLLNYVSYKNSKIRAQLNLNRSRSSRSYPNVIIRSH